MTGEWDSSGPLFHHESQILVNFAKIQIKKFLLEYTMKHMCKKLNYTNTSVTNTSQHENKINGYQMMMTVNFLQKSVINVYTYKTQLHIAWIAVNQKIYWKIMVTIFYSLSISQTYPCTMLYNLANILQALEILCGNGSKLY